DDLVTGVQTCALPISGATPTTHTLTLPDAPVAGNFLKTDASGTLSWAAAGGGAGTNIQHRWEANGPFKVDTSVDGAYIAPHAVTITQTRLHRRAAGSSGTTTVVLKQNGTIKDTRNVTAAAGADATDTSGALSVAVVAGDRLTVDATAVEAGTPLDYDFIIEAA